MFQVHVGGGGRYDAVHQRHGRDQEGGAAPCGVDGAGGAGGTGTGAAPRTPAARRKEHLHPLKGNAKTIFTSRKPSLRRL